MSDDRKYVRIYYSINDDPKFDTIRNHEARFYTWVRLLMAADAVWPSSADLPRWVKRSPLLALVDAGLVELLPGERFRIKGMNDERGRRAEAARIGGLASGRSRAVERPLNDRSESGGTESNLAKQSKAEPSRDESEQRARDSDDGRADLEAFLVIKRRAPTARQRQILDDVLQRHDLTGPAWAADVMFKHPDDPIGAVLEADKEWREMRIQQAQEAEAPKPIPRRSPGLPQTTREIMAEMAVLRRKEPA